MTSILLARKRVFEGIMSRLHFTQLRRGASKNFVNWLCARNTKLDEMSREEEDVAQPGDADDRPENLTSKVKALRQQLDEALETMQK